MIAERKRVLFLVPAIAGGAGGAERVISTLLRHVDHSRFECHLALVGAGGAFLERIPKEVVVHRLGVSRMRFAAPAIVRLARRLAPRTILSTVVYVNVMLVLAKPWLAGRPKILLRETGLPSVYLATAGRHRWMLKQLYRHLYPRADRVICLSEAMVSDMVEQLGIPRDKLVRIYNPVDAEMVRGLADAQPPFRELGPHIVAAGRLQHEKAYDVLLQALPAVLAAAPSARLTILGEGPLEQSLKRQAVELRVNERVDFLGFDPNPWPYAKHADVFVLVSRSEGLPNVVLEVMTLGTPVVATRCSGGLAEILDAGDDVVTIAPEDPAALAEAIISVLARPRRRSDRNSAGPAKCDVRHIVDEYSALL